MTRGRLAGVATLVALATAACGSLDRSAPDESTPSPHQVTTSSPSLPDNEPPPPTPTPEAYDPPTAFDTVTGSLVELNANGVNVFLYRRQAFIATPNEIVVFDSRSDDIVSVTAANPESESESESDFSLPVAPPPVVIQWGDRTLAATPFVVNLQGHGTTPDRAIIEVVAVDVETYEEHRLELGLPEGVEDYTSVEVVTVGTTGTTLVIKVAYPLGEMSTTYAVDLNAQRLVWRRDDFAAAAVTDTAVVGFDTKGEDHYLEYPVVARSVEDGSELWASSEDTPFHSRIFPGGPKFVVLHEASVLEDAHLKILNAASGEVESDLAGGFIGPTCQHDDLSVTVCEDSFSRWVAGFDASSGEWLWSLPEERLTPDVSVVWHGVVYGETENGPVMLDAATGADLPETPEIAPIAVNEYLAVSLNEQDDYLEIYRTSK